MEVKKNMSMFIEVFPEIYFSGYMEPIIIKKSDIATVTKGQKDIGCDEFVYTITIKNKLGEIYDEGYGPFFDKFESLEEAQLARDERYQEIKKELCEG